jgi:integration host factor subunit beta
VTKSDLIAKLAARYPQLAAKDVEVAVNAILTAIASTMVNGERTGIRDFGALSINHRPSRTGRNPRTGLEVAVPEKYAPHFKPGRELKERVDR